MSSPAISVDAQPIPRGISIREFARSQSMAEQSVRRRVGSGEIPSYKVAGARRIPLSYIEQLQRGDPVEAAIERIVAAAPPLTDDQRNRISALLRTGRAEQPGGDVA
jgi:hypothetical protein